MTKKGYWMGMVDVTGPANYPEYQAALKPRQQYSNAQFAIVEWRLVP